MQRTFSDYPPDEYFRSHVGISFTWLFIVLAVLAAVTDYLLFGTPDTGIPYNYPLFVGLLYIVSVLVILRTFYRIIDNAKAELIDIIDRTSADNVMFERDSEVTPGKIESEVTRVLNRAFHPYVILGGGLIGGTFGLAIMWLFGLFQYYPHLLMNYVYGAGHGFFYGPIIGTVYLVYKVSTEYIVDIDILDPDGVGGYRNIGNAIINLIVFGIYLVTLDFIVLSSVTFVDEPVFQAIVFGLYVLMLCTLLAISVVGILLIRRRLLHVRERKTELMRKEFNRFEEAYWRKVDRNESPQPEADYIMTMDTMFDRLHSMELWPINLATLSRLGASAASSAAIALYQAGWIELPM